MRSSAGLPKSGRMIGESTWKSGFAALSQRDQLRSFKPTRRQKPLLRMRGMFMPMLFTQSTLWPARWAASMS